MDPSVLAVLVTGRGPRVRRLAVDRLRTFGFLATDDEEAIPAAPVVAHVDAGVVVDNAALRAAAAAAATTGETYELRASGRAGACGTIAPRTHNTRAARADRAPIGSWLPDPESYAALDGPARAIVYTVLWGATGYAAVGRNLVVGLTARGVPAAGRNVWWYEASDAGIDPRERALLERAGRLPHTNETPAILIRPAGEIGGNASYSDFAATRTRGPAIAYTMFECDGIPARWVRSLREFENVWVPSRFNLHTFAESGVDPATMRVVPIGIDAPAFDPDGPRLNLPNRRSFAFLSVFDWNERKGPDVLLRAWAAAFGPDDDVVLYVRTGRSTVGAVGGPLDQIRALGLDPACMAPIEVLTDDLSVADYASLYRSVDAFVLTSRGEAFCIPLLEAMAAGLPAIGTGYGGSADFLDASTGYPVSSRLAPVGDDLSRRVPFYARQRWADPSVDDTTAALRRIVDDPSDARRRAAAGFARANLAFDRRVTAREAERALVEARPRRRSVYGLAGALLWGPVRETGAAGQATRALLRSLEESEIAVRLVDGGKHDEEIDPELSRALRRAERLAPADTVEAAIAVDALVPGTRAVFLTALPPDITPLGTVDAIWTADETVARGLVAQGIPAARVRTLSLPADVTLWTPDMGTPPTGGVVIYIAPEPRRVDAFAAFARVVRPGDAVALTFAPGPDAPVTPERIGPELAIAMRLAGVAAWNPQAIPIAANATSRGAVAPIASASVAIAADPAWPGHDLARSCGVPVVDATELDLLRRLLADPAERAVRGAAARREARWRARSATVEIGAAFSEVASLMGPVERAIRPTRVLVVVDAGVEDAAAVVAGLRRTARHEIVEPNSELRDLDYVARVTRPVEAPESWDEMLINTLMARPVTVAESCDWAEVGPLYPAGTTYEATLETAALSRNCESGARADTAIGALRMMRAANATATGPAWRSGACLVRPLVSSAQRMVQTIASRRCHPELVEGCATEGAVAAASPCPRTS